MHLANPLQRSDVLALGQIASTSTDQIHPKYIHRQKRSHEGLHTQEPKKKSGCPHFLRICECKQPFIEALGLFSDLSNTAPTPNHIPASSKAFIVIEGSLLHHRLSSQLVMHNARPPKSINAQSWQSSKVWMMARCCSRTATPWLAATPHNLA